MNATIPSQSDLASSDRSCSNRRADLTVDPQRRRPRCSRVGGFHIKKVAVHGIPQVIEQMQRSSTVHDGLWLNPAVRHTDDRNVRISRQC